MPVIGRILFSCIIILGLSANGMAQEFRKGNVAFQLGFTLSDYNSHEWVSSTLLPLYGTIDIGIHDYVAIGFMAHYFSKTYRREGEVYNSRIPGYEYASDWRIRENYLSVGARGTFLITSFLNEVANTSIPENLHLFTGVHLGLDHYRQSKENEYKDYPTASDLEPFGGPFIGARYLFSDHVGVFTELGIGWAGHRNSAQFGAFGLAFSF